MAFTFGTPFLINTQPTFDQDNVSLAGLVNGLFVAVYKLRTPNSPDPTEEIGLQIFKRGRQQARRRSQLHQRHQRFGFRSDCGERSRCNIPHWISACPNRRRREQGCCQLASRYRTQ